MQFLSNGGLSKMAYIILVNLATLGALVIIGIQILTHEPVNQTMLYILMIGLSHGATIGGMIGGSAAQQALPQPITLTSSTSPLALEQPTTKVVRVTPPTSTNGGSQA